MDWNNHKVLVTGGAGMIGSNLVARLRRLGADVCVADNLWRGRKTYLWDKGEPLIDFERQFHELDLTNYDNCLTACAGVETVFHLADVVAGINYVFGNQLSLFGTNVVLNSNMLRAAIASEAKNFVYVGTACSYPAEKQSQLNPPPFKEEDVYPASPESSYGWSKLMGEYECGLAAEEGLINTGILRLHNVYGPHSELSPDRSQVIPALIRKAIEYPSQPFVVWGSGAQRRAFVFVDDVVDALIAMRERGMNQGAIQVGPSESISIREIAEAVVALSEKDITIHYDTNRPEGDRDRMADWSKARQILDWAPRTSIDEGLRKTYRWCETQLIDNTAGSATTNQA